MVERNTRHLTSEERLIISDLIEKSGYQELLGVIAQHVSNNVEDFAIADNAATNIRKIAKKLGAN